MVQKIPMFDTRMAVLEKSIDKHFFKELNGVKMKTLLKSTTKIL